jgi:hypothetical protein
MPVRTILPTTPTSVRLESQTPEYVKERLKSANSECRAAIVAILREVEKQESKTLEWMWSNGKRVETLRTEEKYRKPATGDEPVNPIHLCSEVSGWSVSMLNKMAQLFRAFSTDAEKAKLLGYRTASGKPLTWRHMELLLPMNSGDGSTAVFDNWVKKTLDSSWSPETLKQELARSKQVRGESSHGGGRPTKVPPSLKGRVARLATQTDIILKNVGEIYENPQFGFVESVKALSQSAVTKDATDLKLMFDNIQKNLQEIWEFCGRQIDEVLPEVLSYIDECVAAQADQDGRGQGSERE